MKKNLLISLLTIIIMIQFVIINNVNHDKVTSTSQDKVASTSQDKVTGTSQDNVKKENNVVDLSYSYFMNNPIDSYYCPKLNGKSMAEVRVYDEEYEKIWEQEYNKVLNIIEKKCIYDIDFQNLDNFKKSVENLINTVNPVMETEFLEAYDKDPNNPDNRSWGNSTFYSLQSIKGQIYRDACMLIVPYLKGEYEFPTMPSD